MTVFVVDYLRAELMYNKLDIDVLPLKWAAWRYYLRMVSAWVLTGAISGTLYNES